MGIFDIVNEFGAEHVSSSVSEGGIITRKEEKYFYSGFVVLANNSKKSFCGIATSADDINSIYNDILSEYKEAGGSEVILTALNKVS